MEAIYTIGVFTGLAWLVLYAVNLRIRLDGAEQELYDYLTDAKKVVEIADDPRVVIHYKAVVTILSGILDKYFPVRD